MSEYVIKEVFIVQYPVFGHCPYLNSEHKIYVNYAEVPILGRLSSGYKKMDYSCDYCDECPSKYKDEYGRCPLFISAQSEPN